MENVGIKRENTDMTVGNLSLSLRNLFYETRYLSWMINTRKNSKNDLFVCSVSVLYCTHSLSTSTVSVVYTVCKSRPNCFISESNKIEQTIHVCLSVYVYLYLSVCLLFVSMGILPEIKTDWLIEKQHIQCVVVRLFSRSYTRFKLYTVNWSVNSHLSQWLKSYIFSCSVTPVTSSPDTRNQS